MTATAQKRKLRLKERSLKRKNKGKVTEERETIDFFSAENGHLRPSDLGESSSSFAGTEKIAFGERSERPPDLNQFTAKFKTVKTKAVESVEYNNDEDDVDSAEESENEVEEEEVMTKNMRNKKRKARAALRRDDMDGDDGLESIRAAAADMPAMFNQQVKRQKPDGTQAGKNAGSSGGLVKKPAERVGVKAQNELDALRLKVQEAYKLIRDKRRTQQA